MSDHNYGRTDIARLMIDARERDTDYQPPDPITTLIEACWQEAANMQHCQSERDMRIAFQAVIETRLRAIPGVERAIVEDLEGRS